MDQTRELACTAVACRQGDIYPLYSDFDGFDWSGVKGELGRYSDQVRDDLTRSIRNGVKRACDMARDDRRMQITFVAIVGAVAFLSIPKHRRGRADTRPSSEFDAMQAMRTRQTQAKLDAMYKRMYAKEGTQGVLPRTASSKSEGPSKRKGRLPAGIAPLDGTGQSDTRVRRLPAGIAPLLEGRQRESDAKFPRCSPLA